MNSKTYDVSNNNNVQSINRIHKSPMRRPPLQTEPNESELLLNSQSNTNKTLSNRDIFN